MSREDGRTHCDICGTGWRTIDDGYLRTIKIWPKLELLPFDHECDGFHICLECLKWFRELPDIPLPIVVHNA